MPKASVDISKDKLSTIIKQIVDEKTARLIRTHSTVSLDPPMYKESGPELKAIIYEHKYHEGNRTNRWVLLDLYTASALYAVYKNLNPANTTGHEHIRNRNENPSSILPGRLYH